jgi:hypothetical protein
MRFGESYFLAPRNPHAQLCRNMWHLYLKLLFFFAGPDLSELKIEIEFFSVFQLTEARKLANF